MRTFLMMIGVTCLLPQLASAKGQNVNVLYYNGVKFDDRYGKPEHFTGEKSYRDLETGKITSREQYVNGELDGPFAKYDTDGRLEEIGTNRRGKRHGNFKRYGNDGKLSMEMTYVDGETWGVQKDYRDGVVERIYLISPPERVPDTEMSFNKKGQLTQLKCGKHAIGKQDAEWCGMNGKQSAVTIYSDEGKVRATEQYLWGKLHGTVKKFHIQTGQMLSEAKYVRGQEQAGGKRNFDASGTLLFKTDCDDQRASCTETAFFDGGKEVQTLTVWKKGKIERTTEHYQNGKIREELIAEKDHFRINRFDDEGVPRSKGTYIESAGWYWDGYVPDGTVEHFLGGVLWRREQYVKGVRQGLSQHYFEIDKHRIREDSEYQKDQMLRQKVYIDDKLAVELEYMPDGSLKSRKQFNIPKGIEI